MSTIQDFENAPVGATATAPNGNIAIKTGRSVFEWSLYDSRGVRLDNHPSDEMGFYRLNPTAPTTAREALDLAWELAHPVKEGQVVPAGTEIISVRTEILRTYGTNLADQVADGFDELHTRTLDPLPDPKPGWLDAPAVIAFVKGRVGDPQVFTRENETGTQWVRDTKVYHWYELVGVVPLYPKEGEKE